MKSEHTGPREKAEEYQSSKRWTFHAREWLFSPPQVEQARDARRSSTPVAPAAGSPLSSSTVVPARQALLHLSPVAPAARSVATNPPWQPLLAPPCSPDAEWNDRAASEIKKKDPKMLLWRNPTSTKLKWGKLRSAEIRDTEKTSDGLKSDCTPIVKQLVVMYEFRSYFCLPKWFEPEYLGPFPLNATLSIFRCRLGMQCYLWCQKWMLTQIYEIYMISHLARFYFILTVKRYEHFLQQTQWDGS
jgi:hypothetical protein